MALLDPRFRQGLTRRGTNARGSALTLPNPAMMKPQAPPQWEAAQMWPMPSRPQDFPFYGPPAEQQPQPPAAQPPVPAQPPPQQGMASLMGMMPQRPQQGGGLDPNMKAIMDAMTGARVHKGMNGQQIGMEGVDPNLKYMLYAMRGRRHKSMGNRDIY